ncbi:MAG: DUF4129 domain-containing protein [Chitinophagaceae bacterium]|nr:MAG: DUF4129 domain-containing protein [Chitinophagaceae bacterium]
MSKRTLPCFALLLAALLGTAPGLRAQEETVTDTVIYTPPGEDAIDSPPAGNEANSSFIAAPLAASDSQAVRARRVPPATVQALRADDAFWYVDERPEAPRKKKLPPPERRSSRSFFSDRWISYLLWTVVGVGIIAALLAFLSAIDASPFGRRRKPGIDEEGAPTEEDLLSFDFDAAIAAAAASRNFRLAIRLHYLRLLRLLTERDIIQYRQERTNGAYVSQLYGTAYHADFFRITRYYEYAWYGQLPVSEKAYDTVCATIDGLKNRLP